MTRRVGEWHLLGRDSDPVPADAVDVAVVASEYESRGRRLRESHGVLDRLARLDGWSGEAAEVFASRAQDRLEDLDKAATKYERAGVALRSFAEAVGTARDISASALRSAEDADRARRTNLPDPVGPATSAAPSEADAAADVARGHRYDAALDALASARSRLDNAVDDLESAARACAHELEEASDSYSDSWFKDDIIRGNVGFLKAACHVLEVVGAVLAVAGLALALIAAAPLAAIAAGVLAAGVVAAGLLVAARGALVYSDTGSATVTDLVWDTVGFALAAVGGRAAISLGRAGKGLASSLSAARSGLLAGARSQLGPVSRFMLRFAGSRNPFTRPFGAYAMRRLEAAAGPALREIDATATLRATVGQRLAALDTEAANITARARSALDLNLADHLQAPITQAAQEVLTTAPRAIHLGYINAALGLDNNLDVLTDGVASPGATLKDLGGTWEERVAWRLSTVGS